MEAGSSLGLARGADTAADRSAAGVAGDPAAADQPIPQPHQKLVAGGRDRLSGSGLGLRRHDAQPDRPGDRNHRHHHGRLSPDLAGHQCDHELLWLADRPEPSADERSRAPSLSSGRILVPERPAPVKTTGFVGFLRTRLFNSPTNILMTIVSAAAAVVHRRSRAQIPVCRCGLARHGSQRLVWPKRRPYRRGVLAVRAGEIQPVHLRLLSASRSDGGSI